MNTVRAIRPSWVYVSIAVAVLMGAAPAFAQSSPGISAVKVATIPIHRETSAYGPTPTPSVQTISATPRAWMTVPPVRVQTIRIDPTAPQKTGDQSWPNR